MLTDDEKNVLKDLIHLNNYGELEPKGKKRLEALKKKASKEELDEMYTETEDWTITHND